MAPYIQTRRLEIARQALIQEAGIEPARVELVADAAKATAEHDGAGSSSTSRSDEAVLLGRDDDRNATAR